MTKILNMYGPTGSGKTTSIMNIVDSLKSVVGKEKQEALVGVLDDYKFSTIEQLHEDTKDMGEVEFVLVLTEERINDDEVYSLPIEQALEDIKKGLEISFNKNKND